MRKERNECQKSLERCQAVNLFPGIQKKIFDTEIGTKQGPETGAARPVHQRNEQEQSHRHKAAPIDERRRTDGRRTMIAHSQVQGIRVISTTGCFEPDQRETADVLARSSKVEPLFSSAATILGPRGDCELG